MNVEKLIKVMDESGFKLINSPRGKEFVPKPGKRVVRIPLVALEELDKEAPAKKKATKKVAKKVEVEE